MDETRLATYSDSVWDDLLSGAGLEAVMAATEITSAPPTAVEGMVELMRLPRTVIAEARRFTEEYAEACRRVRDEDPAMPIPDPWALARKESLDTAVCRCIDRVAQLARQRWGLPSQTATVSRSAAESELRRELAAMWETGQRTHYEALRKGSTAGPPRQEPGKPAASEGPKRSRRRRHETTEERLAELVSSEEGRQKILAAGTITKVGKLIKRSHAAVGGSRVWKTKIKPLIDTLRVQQKYSRLEWEERRQDRSKTD
jgi:hypothetical protein